MVAVVLTTATLTFALRAMMGSWPRPTRPLRAARSGQPTEDEPALDESGTFRGRGDAGDASSQSGRLDLNQRPFDPPSHLAHPFDGDGGAGLPSGIR